MSRTWESTMAMLLKYCSASVEAKTILPFHWIAGITLSSEIIINLWLHVAIGTFLQITWGPITFAVWSSVLLSCRLLIPLCLHTILYRLLFFFQCTQYFQCTLMYTVFSVHTHVFNFETHVGLCPRLLTFSLAKFVGSPTASSTLNYGITLNYLNCGWHFPFWVVVCPVAYCTLVMLDIPRQQQLRWTTWGLPQYILAALMKKRKDDEWDYQYSSYNWGVAYWWKNTCRTKTGECSTQWAFHLKRSAIIKNVSHPKMQKQKKIAKTFQIISTPNNVCPAFIGEVT